MSFKNTKHMKANRFPTPFCGRRVLVEVLHALVGLDRLGRIWAGGGIELVQAGLGMVSRVGGGLGDRGVMRGPR